MTISRFSRSGIREVMDLAASLRDVIHLELGEPDFPTPPHIVEAVQRAMRDGGIKYTLSRGDPGLRELLAGKLSVVNGVTATADAVVVTPGGTAAVFAAVMATVSRGDAVLLPDLGWPSFEAIARLAGGEIRHYQLRPENGFEPDPDEIERLARGSRLLVINTPANPSGAVLRRGTIEALLEVARRHDLIVISDEVYEQIVFEGEHVSPTALDPDGRVIGVFSFSKAYAMTGWRIGYLTGARAIVEEVVRVQEAAAACPSWLGQQGAIAALIGSQSCIAEMRAAYRQRRDVAVAALAEEGLLAATPRGAFYVLARIGDDRADTYAFVRRLLQEAHVAVAPGETFGSAGAGLVRISLAAAPAALAQGIAALAEAIRG